MNVPHELATALEGRYRIERPLARGGMATVYLAQDLKHDRLVAIKVLSSGSGDALDARFTREIALTARLAHPHILPLLDSGRADDSVFYVMPLVTGASLRGRITELHELAIDDALRIAIDVADALDYAHRNGIVHRDVKPENILLQQGRPVIADFGIARVHDGATTQLTGTGVSLGTPTYMAPEQIVGERTIDGRADVYALGCVLYEMLTGSPPFSGPNPRMIMARHAADAPPSIRSVRPAVPEHVERLVHRAMAKVPADRFATAGDLRDALTAALAKSPSRGPAWVKPTVAAVLLIAVAAVAIAMVARRDGGGNVRQSGAVVPAESTRLAVLPMANLSPDTADRYFAAGMTDELISTLSEIGGMRVIARSAVMRYASTTKPLTEIGRELGVGSIIESTVRKDKRHLRIGVRLVDAATQEQRWSQQYDREMADMFVVQREIARRVADALRVRLAQREASALAQLPTRNPDAMELYLRARSVRGQSLTREDIEGTIALLKRALAIDSNFALAHALLGERYSQLLFGYSLGEHYRALSSQSIERALALDPNLAEAYQARGDLEYTREAGWRLDDAQVDFQKALALKPSLATAHGKLGVLLMHIGLFEPAMRELRASIALDPFDPFPRLRVGRVLWQQQRFDSALAAFEHGPDIPAEHALVLGYLNRAADGIAFLDSVSRRIGNDAGDIDAARAVLYARLGRVTEAERELRLGAVRDADKAHFHHAAFSLATASVLLGRPADAVSWLKRMTNGGMPAYELIVNDPIIGRLKGNADYEVLMRVERERYERFRTLLAAP